MIKKKYFFKTVIWVSKNAEFDADFDSVETVEKIHAKKLLTKT
jgi:hypothetical protein